MRQLDTQEITQVAGATHCGGGSISLKLNFLSCFGGLLSKLATCEPEPKPVCSPKPTCAPKPSCGSPAPAPAPAPAPTPAPAPDL
ncbi:MAG: hypothetical protein RJB60_1216 [Pseudomonadota bacterium]|jgi:hypothetical protein